MTNPFVPVSWSQLPADLVSEVQRRTYEVCGDSDNLPDIAGFPIMYKDQEYFVRLRRTGESSMKVDHIQKLSEVTK